MLDDRDDAIEYGRYLYHNESKRSLKQALEHALADGCPRRWLLDVELGWMRERSAAVCGENDCG